MDEAKRFENEWATGHGNDYLARNDIKANDRITIWKLLLEKLDIKPTSVLEVGANRGHNLSCIKEILGCTVDGIEINEEAIKQAFVPIKKGSAYDLPFKDGEFELVFTAGVLIHLADYEKAIQEMFRVSNKYVLMIEYYDSVDREIDYRCQILCAARPWERVVSRTIMNSELVCKGEMKDFNQEYHSDDFNTSCTYLLFKKY